MAKIITKIRKPFIFCLFNLGVVIITFLLFEGLSSLILLFQEIGSISPVAERLHTRYDEQLGWVNLPNMYIENMYGPGVYLKTNAQGFRDDEDFSVQVPDHKLRVICSGDSFTLGYGVDNDHTWCQQMTSIDDRLQTVNMGQGGYGIDQAYLWYKQDGTELEHNIHLFAFITSDFNRMQQEKFLGYGKPLLSVQNNQLIVNNVPVPKHTSYYVNKLTGNSGATKEAIKDLKSIRLLSQFFQDTTETEMHSVQIDESEMRNTQVDEASVPELVVAKIFEDLQRINESNNSILVLVYFPLFGDYDHSRLGTEKWRQNVSLVSQEAGILFIDLVDDFRNLPPDQVRNLYIHEGGAIGHFSEQGNEYVAQLLYEELLSFPEVAGKFAEKNSITSFNNN